MSVKKLSDLIPDYCTHPDELVGTAELRGTQTEHDPRATGRLPGDPIEDHVFAPAPNPFLRRPPSETRELIRNGSLSPDDERLARRALQLLQLQQSDCTHEGGGFRPPH